MDWLTNSIRNKLLAIAAIGTLLVIGTAFSGFWITRTTLQEFEQVIFQEATQESAIRQLTLDFKKQVQEWKNTLLRGHNPEDLDKYWERFQRLETKIQEEGKQLLSRLQDTSMAQGLEQFLAEHREMGRAYREGLEVFRQAGFDPRAGDKAVR
ncbi:MAG: hypothetical protein ABW153_09180, partial [Sedimenticola sp.]